MLGWIVLMIPKYTPSSFEINVCLRESASVYVGATTQQYHEVQGFCSEVMAVKNVGNTIMVSHWIPGCLHVLPEGSEWNPVCSTAESAIYPSRMVWKTGEIAMYSRRAIPQNNTPPRNPPQSFGCTSLLLTLKSTLSTFMPPLRHETSRFCYALLSRTINAHGSSCLSHTHRSPVLSGA